MIYPIILLDAERSNRMLSLKQITKTYDSGEAGVQALRGIDLNFRSCEFAAVLGPSGCGKTTLLNIIGGLDQYTSGDLIINGKSTRQFKDADWDSYRNHSIGFVFQSYNLIPHQTVLANVELALTLSGVSKLERRKRAIEALEKVGLRDQLKKKPNQMSGGQMQRVAIARALVNDPDILLADEPTGALDSETSVQVMDILKEIAREKLVIMVTHNPELADAYATRIIRLLDGQVVADSMPFDGKDEPVTAPAKRQKTSMSFWTALSLSLNNLMTKKGRTALTAFAGSIGIIGIALILSLSTGINDYIDRVQRDTLSSYPLMIEKQTMEVSGMLTAMTGATGNVHDHPMDQVYSGTMMTQFMSSLMNEIQENDLRGFKKFLESKESGIQELVSGIQYEYATPLTIYRILPDGRPIQVNPSTTIDATGLTSMMDPALLESSSMMSTSFSRIDAFQPLIDNEELLKSQYEILAGRMPAADDEVVVIVNGYNEISDFTLYSLGLKDQAEIKDQMDLLMQGKPIKTEELSFTYEEMLALRFRLMINTDFYTEQDGLWVDRSKETEYLKATLEKAPEIKVVGILRPAEDTVATNVGGGIGYRPGLMNKLLDQINNSEVVKAQLENPGTDIFTGAPFKDYELTMDDIGEIRAYIAQMPAAQQAMTKNMTDEQLLAMAKKFGAAYMPATSESTLEENLFKLGVSDPESPSTINIFPVDFASKEKITAIIEDYNKRMGDEGAIHYTDYVGLLMSSVTNIINAISYILIAFVAISLVVSSIMIGIITYISVLERTKEIGILRAIGASKRDISRVFNAETLIVGFSAGMIGIGVTLLLNIIINIVIQSLTGIRNAAGLPVLGGLALVLISMLLTFIAGLIPSRIAAKKDPVVALRSE